MALPLREGLRVEAQEFAQCLSDPASLELQEQILERYRTTPAAQRVEF
jgi:hypothetical protein